MPVYAVWESHFPAEEMQEGRAITEAIWRDMPQFEGYLADESLRQYANHPNAQRANELVSRPRTRFVGHAVASWA